GPSKVIKTVLLCCTFGSSAAQKQSGSGAKTYPPAGFGGCRTGGMIQNIQAADKSQRVQIPGIDIWRDQRVRVTAQIRKIRFFGIFREGIRITEAFQGDAAKLLGGFSNTGLRKNRVIFSRMKDCTVKALAI